MDEQSRTDKALRAINDEIAREKGVIKGMSADEKWVLAVVVMVAVVIAVMFALLWSAAARANSLEIDIRCENEVCTVAKKDIKALIRHNNLVTQELMKQSARKCRENEI